MAANIAPAAKQAFTKPSASGTSTTNADSFDDIHQRRVTAPSREVAQQSHSSYVAQDEFLRHRLRGFANALDFCCWPILLQKSFGGRSACERAEHDSCQAACAMMDSGRQPLRVRLPLD